MKTTLICAVAFCFACSNPVPKEVATEEAPPAAGQSAVQDTESQKNVVQTAAASPDHKTLVAALKAAGYVDALSNAGPFTVFAPVDKAFDALPAGTLDDLLKPENKVKLRDVLEYHVYVGVIRESMIRSGMKLDQVNGKKVTLTKSGDSILVNDARILASVPTSNGIVYVIDKVLLP
ncbi:MAG TPA: fasciclin domain-containing protein [Chryseosolibacter sp.]